MKTLFLILGTLGAINVCAQNRPGLFDSYDCREHSEEIFHESVIDTASLASAIFPESVEQFQPVLVDTADAWKNWRTVQNYSFGKDRGNLEMINDLKALHPVFRDKIIQLIEACSKKGIQLEVVESYRTYAKQNEYRSMGKKYTRSSGGKSKHQYGLAVDLVPVVDSAAVWDNPVLWRKIGVAGEKLGLRWGGRWRHPYDPGHFEWTGGLSTYELANGKYPEASTSRSTYPCLEEDLNQLRRFWMAWESSQSLLTRK